MKVKIFGPLLAGLLLVAGSAQAVVLSVTGGDNTQTIGSAFSLGAETGLASGDPLIAFNTANAASGDLSVTGGPGKLTFEFLGSEADFTNTFELGGIQLFSNLTSLVGDTASAVAPSGAVNFAFLTSGGGTPRAAVNGGPISAGISFAFAAITDTSLILLFDDGGFGDTDRDDLAVRVSVSQVPLPAAGWLMLSALVGLLSFTRIRRNGAKPV